MKKIRVVLAGPRGKMGQEALKTIMENKDFELVGLIDRVVDQGLIKKVEAEYGIELPIYISAEDCFVKENPDVLVDLTTPENGKKHTYLAIKHHVRSVIGTTGFNPQELVEIQNLCEEKQLGCIIAPNFAIGAILLMKFAQMAVKYFPQAEIIELHHDKKKDAPSGTALKTAQLMELEQGVKKNLTTQFPSQGLEAHGFNIHSVRLPGLVAHQEVIFGGEGQSLTLRHDSYNRTSFMSGLTFSIKKVMEVDTFVYGLEHLVD